MAGKKGKGDEISDYLWLRINKRIESFGLSARQLAQQLSKGEKTGDRVHHGTVTRLISRHTASIKFLPKLRKVLSIPKDDMEDRFNEYDKTLTMGLAEVMTYTPLRTKEFMQDVVNLAALHKEIARVQDACAEAEVLLRQLNIEHRRDDKNAAKLRNEVSSRLAHYEELKDYQAQLEKRRRTISNNLLEGRRTRIDFESFEIG